MFCFTQGTMIATMRGEVPVEALKIGDRVFTRDNGPQAVEWVGTHLLNALDLEGQKNLKPVLIGAGALGGDLPERDMMVSPQHRLLLASDRKALYAEDHDMLSAAKHLTDLPGISRAKPLEMGYAHFHCARHEIVLTNGFWTEAFCPADTSGTALDEAARDEIFRVFPALAEACGVKGYQGTKAHAAKRMRIDTSIKPERVYS